MSSVPKGGNFVDGPLGPKIKAPVVHEIKLPGGGRTVFVACKSPRGLYLQITEWIDQDVRVMGGGIETRKVSMRVGDPVRLRPTVLPFGTVPNYPIVSGFSLTEIDAEFWKRWYELNKNFSMLEAGLLCAFDKEADARAYAREYAALKHGLEPMGQQGDPRTEQPTSENLTDLDIDTDAPKGKG